MNRKSITIIDDLVVGAGITGCLMTFALQKKGRVVGLADIGKENSSSAVAAGIINPVTGKNFVKSWNIDLFLPKAIDMYREIEKTMDVKILEKMNILRQLSGPGAENQWASRLLDENYRNYAYGTTDLAEWNDQLVLQGNYAEIQEAYRVDLWGCIKAVIAHASAQSLFWNMSFDHGLLRREGNVWTYPGLVIQNIIFCEGYKGAENPLFPTQAFALTKGSASWLSVPRSTINKMIKDDIFLVPLGNDQFWVGGGYTAWNPAEKPGATSTGHTRSFQDWIRMPYHLLAEKSAVRPTTKNRRPLIICHPSLPGLYFVNGMGTKGTSMAPYFVSLLADVINGDKGEKELVLPT